MNNSKASQDRTTTLMVSGHRLRDVLDYEVEDTLDICGRAQGRLLEETHDEPPRFGTPKHYRPLAPSPNDDQRISWINRFWEAGKSAEILDEYRFHTGIVWDIVGCAPSPAACDRIVTHLNALLDVWKVPKGKLLLASSYNDFLKLSEAVLVYSKTAISPAKTTILSCLAALSRVLLAEAEDLPADMAFRFAYRSAGFVQKLLIAIITELIGATIAQHPSVSPCSSLDDRSPSDRARSCDLSPTSLLLKRRRQDARFSADAESPRSGEDASSRRGADTSFSLTVSPASDCAERHVTLTSSPRLFNRCCSTASSALERDAMYRCLSVTFQAASAATATCLSYWQKPESADRMEATSAFASLVMGVWSPMSQLAFKLLAHSPECHQYRFQTQSAAVSTLTEWWGLLVQLIAMDKCVMLAFGALNRLHPEDVPFFTALQLVRLVLGSFRTSELPALSQSCITVACFLAEQSPAFRSAAQEDLHKHEGTSFVALLVERLFLTSPVFYNAVCVLSAITHIVADAEATLAVARCLPTPNAALSWKDTTPILYRPHTTKDPSDLPRTQTFLRSLSLSAQCLTQAHHVDSELLHSKLVSLKSPATQLLEDDAQSWKQLSDTAMQQHILLAQTAICLGTLVNGVSTVYVEDVLPYVSDPDSLLEPIKLYAQVQHQAKLLTRQAFRTVHRALRSVRDAACGTSLASSRRARSHHVSSIQERTSREKSSIAPEKHYSSERLCCDHVQPGDDQRSPKPSETTNAPDEDVVRRDLLQDTSESVPLSPLLKRRRQLTSLESRGCRRACDSSTT